MLNILRNSDDEDLKKHMKLLMNTWIRHRQMGEAEAVYRLTKEFHFRDTDSKCVFGNERSKILKNVTGKPEYRGMPKISVDSHKDGEYIEQYDVNSKYDRRDIEGHIELDKLSFSHMVKMYEAFWGLKKKTKIPTFVSRKPMMTVKMVLIKKKNWTRL